MYRLKVMEIPTHQELIDDLNEHLRKTGIKPFTFGKENFNDSAIVVRLREGSDPRLSTVQKIYKIITRKTENK